METVFTHQSLVSCLSKLPVHTPRKQIRLWVAQKNYHQRTDALVRALGTPATKAQANRLDSLGLSVTDLVKLYRQSQNSEVFSKTLKDLGVNSKPLRDKLLKSVPRSC